MVFTIMVLIIIAMLTLPITSLHCTCTIHIRVYFPKKKRKKMLQTVQKVNETRKGALESLTKQKKKRKVLDCVSGFLDTGLNPEHPLG